MSELAQESIRKDVIARLISYIKNHASAKKADALIALAPQYYRTIPLEDFTHRSIEDMYNIMINHFELMQQRQGHRRNLRVFNPNYETHGWLSTHTVVELSYDDMPFLVDSMRVEVNRMGYTVHLIVSAGGLKIQRDEEGKLTHILAPESTDKALTEAVVHFEIDRITDPKALEELHKNLEHVLQDATVVVNDWEQMSGQINKVLQELTTLEKAQTGLSLAEISETKIFLEWLADHRFTFLGYRQYEYIGEGDEAALHLIPHTGLGVLRDETGSRKIRYFHDLPPKARKLVLSPHLLIISKTNTKATVHRSAYTDYIGVKRFDDKGNFIGEHRFIGLYTSEAYNSDPQNIPLLRHKVETVLNKSGLPRTGHGARALRNIIATLPRDDLFQASTDELYELAMGILHLQERRRIRLFIRKDAYNRYYSCLVYVPRDNFNTELLYHMRDILVEALHGTEVSFATHFYDSVLARIHFVVRVDSKKPVSYDLESIEKRLIEVGHSWYDDLRDSLLEHFGEEKGNELIAHYLRGFPAGYRETFTPLEAIHDIDYLERLKTINDLEMSFYRPLGDNHNVLRFKLFHLATTIPLSDALPMLENLGMRVIGEQPYEILANNSSSKILWINDFNMEYALGSQLDAEANKELFQDAFFHIWRGDVENDRFNRLVLAARLTWHEVRIFRAYAKYLRQAGFTFSQQYIEETLVNNPEVAALLMKLFKLRFDPALQEKHGEIHQVEEEIKKALDLVSNLDQDRILRRYWELIHATLRTNFFQNNKDGKPKSYVSFKFNPKKVPELPLPLPLFEIFVYSPRFEGVHLRAGKVARGGLRWSDRREDFRTEVLGLMKAQQVKNAVIVPAGAKGGFVTKTLPVDGSRDAILEEGIVCYKNFIRGLLDITDNLVGTTVVPPANTVRYDEHDPYLVVAADKGTASFSDIANSISRDENFWLGDAFASGGSMGYDHKKMAITSRGAWESVKHHFQQLSLDINQPFTVVGIGDMSGDVFGNGMLLADKIQLVAAFNHMHIFIDPTPDPDTSFAERKRLFKLPRSSWEDYNSQLISKGGGIYKRSAKLITISPEAQAVLSVEKSNWQPNELINAILKAPVVLIWNGGIGTYVKAIAESNLEVGDRANDSIRINGSDLRCKIVAEGGNLGCTQLGRIEYELNGGKINTDFIDNSAGVDCSDHEVNIKILLNESVNNGDMTEKQRNALLVEMTEEIAALVLLDNYRQVRAITRETQESLNYLGLYMRFISDMDLQGKINPQLEFLPDNKILLERKANGRGLTRPEAAVLMAYSKIILKEEILHSNLVDDSYLESFLVTAFPKRLSENFATNMQQHRLRKEIIATQVSNALVNEMGTIFAYQMQDETSAIVPVIVQAYVIMRQVFDMPWLLAAVDVLQEKMCLDRELEALGLEMTLEAMRLTRRAVRWLLSNRRPPYNISSTIKEFSGYVKELYQELPKLLVGAESENFNNRMQALVNTGIPKDVAERVASARYIYSSLNIILIATDLAVPLDTVASIYFGLAEQLDLVWFREKINAYPVDNHWSVLARSSFKDVLDKQQRALTISVLQHMNKNKDIATNVNEWLEAHQLLLPRWQMMLTQLRNITVIDPAMLTVALRELSDLAQMSIVTEKAAKI